MFEINPKKESPVAGMEGIGGGASSLLFNHTPRVYAVGQVVFDGNNTNATWTVPANVYSISVVAVGRGDGGRGQAAWTVNGPSAHHGTATAGHFTGNPGSSRNGQKGGSGVSYQTGWGGAYSMAGGGGAAGYSGDGGTGVVISAGNAGAGGGGGAGGGESIWGATGDYAGGGGGVGLLGQGSNGAGGSNPAGGGGGGSGGSDGATGTSSPDTPGDGGNYGGGGGGYGGGYNHTKGGGGGIRIIYPGHERQYPSTRTADE